MSAQQSPGTTQPSVVVGGRVLQGAELKLYAQKNGLCHKCAQHRTHKRTGHILKSRWEPIDIQKDKYGVITVYRGHCIQPTCYPSVDHVRELLGEISKPRYPKNPPPGSDGATTRASSSQEMDVGTVATGYTSTQYGGYAGMHGGGGGGANYRHSEMSMGMGGFDAGSHNSNSLNSSNGMMHPNHPSWGTASGNYGPSDGYQNMYQQQPQHHHSQQPYPPAPNSGQPYNPNNATFGGAPASVYNPHDGNYNQIGTSPTPGRKFYNPSQSQHHQQQPQYQHPLLGDPTAGSGNQVPPNFAGGGGGGVPKPAMGRQNSDISNSPSYYKKPAPHNNMGSMGNIGVGGVSGDGRGSSGNLGGGSGSGDDQTSQGDGKTQRERRYEHPVIEELYQIISDGDYIRFLNLLEEKGTEAEVAREGFQLFSKHVVEDQIAKPTAVIVPGGEWAKTLKRNMERFPHDSGVVRHGLLCMITLSTLHEKYKRAMVKKGALDIVILVLKNHAANNDPQLVKLAASFVFVLSADDKDGLNVKTNHVVTAIREMAGLLTGHPGDLQMAPARAFAVAALWNLANQKRKSESTGKSLLFDVQNVLVGPEIIPSLVEVVCVAVSGMVGGGDVEGEDESHPMDDPLAAPSVHAAAGLLQLCLFPNLSSKTSSNNDNNASNASTGTGSSGEDLASSPQILNELMGALAAALEPREPEPNMNNIACLQACCSLMGNMALPLPNTTHFPGSGWRTPAVHAISQMLAAFWEHQDNPSNKDARDVLEGLALSGIHAICNWLAKKQVGARRNNQMTAEDGRLTVTVILQCLSHFPKNADLQELGCLALAYCCRPGSEVLGTFSCAEFAVEQGAMDRIDTALTDHGALFESEETRNNFPALQVRRGALSAMAALTQCSAGVNNLVHTGRLDQVEVLSAVEQEPDVQDLLQSILEKCRGGGGMGSVSYSTSFGSSHGGGGMLRQQPEAFARLINTANSEENITSAINELQVLMGEKGVPDSDKLAPFFVDRGMDILLEAMGRFDTSAVVQESGCGILAELYCLAPYQIASASSTVRSNTSWTLIQAQAVIDTLRNAMKRHKGHPGVQNFVCLALSNFLGPLCDETPGQNHSSNPTSHDLEVVRGLVDPCLKDVLNTMAINQQNAQVQKSAIQLFWTLSFVCHKDNMKLWMLRVVQQIFHAMQEFPLDVELNVTACNALLAFQNDSDALDYFGSADGVRSLLAIVLDGEGEQVVAGATAVLASTVKKIFSAIGHIVQGPETVEKLIACMKANTASSEIQLYLCSIFESLAALEDYRVPAMIYEAGGLDAICDTLSIHRHEESLAEYGCRILSVVIGTTQGNAVSAHRHRLRDSLIQIMEIHFGNPQVQSTVLDSLCTCCRQDRDFINILVYETPRSVDLIVQSMNNHMIWPDLQRSGCSLIRSMSSFNQSDLQLQMMLGEKGAVAAIVNGMSAHPDSSALQKEALRALKCLAMIASNKPQISAVEGETAVMNGLWIHMRDPQLVSQAFSALNNIIVTNRKAGPLSEDAMRALIIAMGRFKRDESVQKQACFLLNSASFLNSNLDLMRAYGRQLTELLYGAAETFPNACQKLAMGVVKKMSR